MQPALFMLSIMSLFLSSQRLYLCRIGLFFALGFSILCLSCGGKNSGSGAASRSDASNPVPSISSLSPSSASAGGSAFTLTITGQNFVSGATVQWNGSVRPTTFSSSTQLQTQITAADVAKSGSAAISVLNPSPGGGSSGLAEFQVNGTNPSPDLLSMNPSVVDAGSSGFLLTVNGENFIPGSVIQWNGSALPTSYLSDTQLEAQVPAANVAASGFIGVSVMNPLPGGGVSSLLPFSISYLPTVVNQLADDLVWDDARQLIYLTVPSLAGSNGNSIAALDPLTGNIQSAQFAGSEPDKLAISNDDQYLYAGLDGSSSVQRFTLPNLAPDINYSLGASSIFGPTFAWDLQVAPGLPHTAAVSRGIFSSSPWSAIAGVQVFDDSAPRTTIASGPPYDSLQWGSDSTLYANNAEVTNFNFFVLSVSGSGVVQTKDYPNVFSQFYMSIHYDSVTKLLYGDDGTVVNPSTGKIVASFAASGFMVPDDSTKTAYFLGQTAFQAGSTTYTLASFDLTTLAPLSEIVIPNVQGIPLRLIRWGTNGLAFNDDAGYVYIVNNSAFVGAAESRARAALSNLVPVKKNISFPRVPAARSSVAGIRIYQSKMPKAAGTLARSADSVTPNPTPAINTLSPNAAAAGMTGLNGFTLTVFGSNFVSLSTVEWNGSPRPTEFVSSTELQAQMSFSDALNPGAVPVTVVTPSPGGGTSNPLTFTILSSTSNHAPILTSLYPNSAPAGSSGLTLDINGYAYFTPSTVVEWNGIPRPATLYGPGQLQVQVTASDLATPGYAQITVINPGPNGGSASADFQILYQPKIVNQTANDMVWDPVNKLIYFSVPGSAGTNRNQVCSMNPAIGAIITCHDAGTDPDVVAISDDSKFLYVGEDGSYQVQRFTLPSLTPDITYSLGSDPFEGPYMALDIQVAPGAPHTVAISKGTLNLDPHTIGGITIYDDSTPRPTSAPGWGTGNSYDSLQWGADANTLYASCTEIDTFDFFALDVTSSGVVLKQDYPGVFWNPGRIHYERGNGLVYSDDGYHAVNPMTGLPTGIYEVGGGWPMVPDVTLGHVFLLDAYVWQGNSDYTISVFDMTHYVPILRIPFSTVPGGIQRLGRFIRWGSNGLAVNDTEGNLYLISGPFVN